jgi:hypothetical protein
MEHCKKARTGKIMIKKETLQNKNLPVLRHKLSNDLMAKKSPTEIRPLTLSPFSLAVPRRISLIIGANCFMFYVSKRQAILLVESLFYYFVIEINFALASTVLTFLSKVG